MKTEYCPRCGKVKHDKKCVFDKAKKSVVEATDTKMSAVLTDVDALKKTK
jgi:hypothetical protein